MKKFVFLIFAMFVVCAYGATENMDWYVDGEVYSSTTCQSGDNVILPAAPAKDGYVFSGWVSGFYDFSTLDPTVKGNGSKIINVGAPVTQWSLSFSYGTIYGDALCGVSSGVASGEVGNPSPGPANNDSKYCWCRVTGLQADGYDFQYEPVSPLPWVYSQYFPNYCISMCARACITVVDTDENFRRAIFGIN